MAILNMSPEMKIREFKRFCFDSRASDVCSLGVILFEMIKFNRPFGEIDSIYDRQHLNRQLNRDYIHNQYLYSYSQE